MIIIPPPPKRIAVNSYNMLTAEMHADSITTNLVSFRSIIYHALLRIQVFLMSDNIGLQEENITT